MYGCGDWLLSAACCVGAEKEYFILYPSGLLG
jgi:hypothetical protein